MDERSEDEVEGLEDEAMEADDLTGKKLREMERRLASLEGQVRLLIMRAADMQNSVHPLTATSKIACDDLARDLPPGWTQVQPWRETCIGLWATA